MADTPEGTGFTVDQAAASLLTAPESDTQKDREALPPADTAGDPDPQSDAAFAADDAETPVDDTHADDGSAPEPDAPSKFRFKLSDGTEVEATQDELAKGWLRQQDYTKKTQELANQRKALEQDLSAIRAERDAQIQTLTAAQQLLAQQMPQEPDWARLYHEDPIEFSRQKAAFDLIREKQAAFAQQAQRVQQQAQAEQVAARQQYLAQQHEVVLEKVAPEWKNPEVAKAEKAKLRDYALSVGAPETAINAVAEAWEVAILRDAARYRELMAKRPEVERKAADAPRMAPPTASQNRGNPKALEKARAVQRLAKSGSIDDAVAALLA